MDSVEDTEKIVDQYIMTGVIGTLVILSLVVLFVTFFSISRKRLLQAKTNRQKLIIDHQSALIQNNIKTQEEERRRIAANLHDDIGAKLNVIKLYAHQFKNDTIPAERRKELSEEFMNTIQHTIDSTRQISHQLYPPTLANFGLIESLKEIKDEVNESAQVHMSLQESYDQDRIEDIDVELNIYRILQECLQNSIKYGAKEIRLTIDYRQQHIHADYADDGPGYDPQLVKNQRGMGHQNIENRIQIIGGQFVNLSAPGKGAHYKIAYQPNGTHQNSDSR